MQSLFSIGIPCLAWFLMFAVGVELTAADFRRIATSPRIIVGATIAQIFYLPMMAAGLIIVFEPDERLAAGCGRGSPDSSPLWNSVARKPV